MAKPMRKGLAEWVNATRETRKRLQEKGVTDPKANLEAINQALANTNKDAVDPQGHDIKPKRRK